MKYILILVCFLTITSCKVNHYHYHANYVCENEVEFKTQIKTELSSVSKNKIYWYQQ